MSSRPRNTGQPSGSPFGNIESALEYVTYLLEACREARTQVETEMAQMNEPALARKKDALRVVHYKLERLSSHIETTQHLLKDLRKLRRLILEERRSHAKAATA